MKLRVVGVALVLAAMGVGAFPAMAEEARGIAVENATLAEGGAELQVKFLGQKVVNHACDYTVSRMEYVESASLLIVDLRSPKPCLIDRMGRRAGFLKWRLPANLRGNAAIQIVLNESKAGELSIHGTDVEFRAVAP